MNDQTSSAVPSRQRALQQALAERLGRMQTRRDIQQEWVLEYLDAHDDAIALAIEASQSASSPAQAREFSRCLRQWVSERLRLAAAFSEHAISVPRDEVVQQLLAGEPTAQSVEAVFAAALPGTGERIGEARDRRQARAGDPLTEFLALGVG